MNATSLRPIVHATVSADVRTEMVRHVLDLRIHSAVMLLGGTLVAYCGSRIANFVTDSVSTGSGGLTPALASLGILAIFVTLLGFCLLEAHRCWRKAAVISAQTGCEKATHKATRNLLNPLARPWHLPHRHA